MSYNDFVELAEKIYAEMTEQGLALIETPDGKYEVVYESDLPDGKRHLILPIDYILSRREAARELLNWGWDDAFDVHLDDTSR